MLQYKGQKLETYAILDDGSQRTLLLHSAAQQLGLRGQPEDLPLRRVRQELQTLHGVAVSFTISPASSPKQVFNINRAFTAPNLGQGEHTYSTKALQQKFKNLRDLPIPQFENIHPTLLIGSDHTRLITPLVSVHSGLPGAPVAIRTLLGWTFQGPVPRLKYNLTEQTCLFTTSEAPPADLY